MINIIALCWFIFLVYWAVSAFFVKKAVVKRRWGWRWILFIVIILFVIFVNATTGGQQFAKFLLINQFFTVTQTVETIAAIFAVLGLAGAIWARIYLGRNWSGYVTYKRKHELVTDGPYKYVRHPIYSSIILMLIGTWLSFPTIWVSVFFIIYISIFLWRKGKEEAIMIRLFGKKYKDYMKRTKALIPGVW